MFAVTVGLAGCGDDSAEPDLTVVPHDLSGNVDMAKHD
jgi:hypothetical protein